MLLHLKKQPSVTSAKIRCCSPGDEPAACAAQKSATLRKLADDPAVGMMLSCPDRQSQSIVETFRRNVSTDDEGEF